MVQTGAMDENVTPPTCWLIRAGERSRHARAFVNGSVVAVGWPDIEGLGDLRTLSTADIHAALRTAAHIKRPDQDAAELTAFRDDVRVGDIVITPDATTREALVGVVTGDYDYRDPSPTGDYLHVRDVKWFSRIDRTTLDEDLDKALRWRRTIRRLGDQDRWLVIAEEAEAGRGRPPAASGSSKTRSASTAKIADADRPTRVCPHCGFAWPLAQYIAGSDACVGCR